MKGTVSISVQMSCIKIETLRSKNPTQMHSALSEVCGEFIVDSSAVSRWANHFRGACMSINNYPRPGRQRTLKDERSVKFVADDLEKYRRATCEKLSRATGVKPSQQNAEEPTPSCSWLGHSFSMTMLAHTSRML